MTSRGPFQPKTFYDSMFLKLLVQLSKCYLRNLIMEVSDFRTPKGGHEHELRCSSS